MARVRNAQNPPLMTAMYTRDEQTFGKYLSRPGNFFAAWPPDYGSTREYLQAMQEVGAVRQDINTRAMAFILDALTPSILAALSLGLIVIHKFGRVGKDRRSAHEVVVEQALPWGTHT